MKYGIPSAKYRVGIQYQGVVCFISLLISGKRGTKWGSNVPQSVIWGGRGTKWGLNVPQSVILGWSGNVQGRFCSPALIIGQSRSGIVVFQDPAVGVAFGGHYSGAYLAESHTVSPAGAVQDYL